MTPLSPYSTSSAQGWSVGVGGSDLQPLSNSRMNNNIESIRFFMGISFLMVSFMLP